MRIQIDYCNGVEHPLFWRECESCGSKHGPYKLYSTAQTKPLCDECDGKLTEKLRHYRAKERS